MLACNFVDALPRGPLWDRAKAEAITYLTAQNGCDEGECPPSLCHSIVTHAVYTANRLWHVLMEALWPALRESDPFTCFDTVDDWLQRFGWQSCFDSACRDKSLGDLTPLEVLGECCKAYCPPDFDPDLQLAVKLGIVRALARLDMGIIPNLDAINFVIEPLGAVVRGVGLAPNVTDPDACPVPDDGLPGCDYPTDHPVIEICHASDYLPKPKRSGCDLPNALEPNTEVIRAYHQTCPDRDAAGLPDRIWPGVLAAECIVRSLIWPGQNIEIQRCC